MSSAQALVVPEVASVSKFWVIGVPKEPILIAETGRSTNELTKRSAPTRRIDRTNRDFLNDGEKPAPVPILEMVFDRCLASWIMLNNEKPSALCWLRANWFEGFAFLFIVQDRGLRQNTRMPDPRTSDCGLLLS